jgi:hypothetical protein
VCVRAREVGREEGRRGGRGRGLCPAASSQGLACGVWSLGFGVWSFGFGVRGVEVWGLGFGIEDSGLGLRFGIRISGFGFRVLGSGFRVLDLGYRVLCLGFWVVPVLEAYRFQTELVVLTTRELSSFLHDFKRGFASTKRLRFRVTLSYANIYNS